MSRLYGTKDTLKELSLLTQGLYVERSKIKSSGRQGSKKMMKLVIKSQELLKQNVFCGNHHYQTIGVQKILKIGYITLKRHYHARIKRSLMKMSKQSLKKISCLNLLIDI